MQVIFEIYNDDEYWCARGLGVDIFTQGRGLNQLIENIKEAVKLHYEDVFDRE